MEASNPSVMGPAEANNRPARRVREAALIALLALTLNLAGNARTSLWDRDEPRYAGCVREMRARGDWIYPTFNGEARFNKPILIYWLMRAGTAIGGENPFGARLASALAGAGTCLLVWGLGRRIFGPRAGLLAALVMATAPIVVAESKLATTDATLAFFLVGSQYCLWELGKRPSRFLAGLFWVLMALATLTKGPVGPALIAVAGVGSWWAGGPTACWTRLHWRWGLSGFVFLTAPWFVAIGLATRGEFFNAALGNHLLNRITTGIEQHEGFPGYYVVMSLLTFYPWSALLPAALVGAWARRKARPEFGFLLGWVVGPLILLECVQTKLIHYYLPAFAACALLVAWLIGAVAEDVVNLRRWPLGRLSLGLLSGLGIGGTVALIAGAAVLPASMRWPSLALAVPMCVGTLFALERFYHGAPGRAATGLVATWALVMWGLGAWLLPAAEPYRISRIVGERLAVVSARERAVPMLGTFQQPAVIYALGRPAPLFRGRVGLTRRLREGPPVVTALLASELAFLQGFPELQLLPRETLRGFNVDKGRTETLHLTLIRLRPLDLAARPERFAVK